MASEGRWQHAMQRLVGRRGERELCLSTDSSTRCTAALPVRRGVGRPGSFDVGLCAVAARHRFRDVAESGPYRVTPASASTVLRCASGLVRFTINWAFVNMLSTAELHALISGRCISDRHPWAEQNASSVEAFYKSACATVERTANVSSRTEWDHYGSGYASYIDAWFYRPVADFHVDHPLKYGHEYKGLVVLLSRLAPFFAFMEEEKRWSTHGASSYLPSLEAIDDLRSPAVRDLAARVQVTLEGLGLTRAFKADLALPLPQGVSVTTNLTDRGFTQFDALFYWND